MTYVLFMQSVCQYAQLMLMRGFASCGMFDQVLGDLRVVLECHLTSTSSLPKQ